MKRTRIIFRITNSSCYFSLNPFIRFILFVFFYILFYFFLWVWVQKNKTIKLIRIIAHVSNLMYCSKTSSSHSFKNNSKQQYLKKNDLIGFWLVQLCNIMNLLPISIIKELDYNHFNHTHRKVWAIKLINKN